MLLYLLTFIFMNDNIVQLRPTMDYEEVPEEYGYLHVMRGTALSETGELFILDVGSSKIFSWDKDGKFQDSWGRKGEGPGEFDFGEKQGSFIFLSEYKGDLYVINGRNRRISIFDSKGNFKSVLKSKVRGYITAFLINDNHNYFFLDMDYYAKPLPRGNLKQFDSDFNYVQRLFTGLDRRMVPTLRGNDKHWRIKVLPSPILVGTMPDNVGIFVGDNENGEISIFKGNGRLVKKIEFNVPKRELDAELRAYLKKNAPKSPVADYVVPEKFTHFEQIFPVDGLGFLLLNNDTMRHILFGHLIDFGGKVLGRFEYNGNDFSFFDSLRGQLFHFYADEESEYQIRKMDIVLNSSALSSN